MIFSWKFFSWKHQEIWIFAPKVTRISAQNTKNDLNFRAKDNYENNQPSRLGVEQSWIVSNVIVFIARHFRQRVVRLQDGQSFAKEFQRLAFEQLAENWKMQKFVHKKNFEFSCSKA